MENWSAKIAELSAELKQIAKDGGNPTFCVRKIYAAASRDMSLYLKFLEEELNGKVAALGVSMREGEITREIVERLRVQLKTLQTQQGEVIEWLREARGRAEDLEAENARLREDLADSERRLDAATGLLAEAGGAEAGLEVLITNLEEENRRCTGRAERAEDLVSELQRVLATCDAERRRYRSERDSWKRMALEKA
jgi:DNA repair exonuclease SbcCD ATPase subunit